VDVTAPQPAPPVKLGRYTLVRPLGVGGMAELYLARVDGIGGFTKLCALKRILPHKATNERFVRMLLNEARLVATLDHPNIAQVHDIGVENNEYFFSMEYVHGQDLRHVLHAAPYHRLRLENAIHIALGLCAGLHHAHEAHDASGASLEIVHRDVSPSNVLISYQGAVKLVDFGVAKAAHVVSETREGIIKGKYGYMSPEQCLGAPLDRRSDIFAVGILLWEMTVGRRLYKLSGDLATLQRVVYVDAPRPTRFMPDYPPRLEAIVMRMLERDVAKRFQTAEEAQLALESFSRDTRLQVSAVTMSAEMRRLFEERIEAWVEAEKQVHARGYLASARRPRHRVVRGAQRDQLAPVEQRRAKRHRVRSSAGLAVAVARGVEAFEVPIRRCSTTAPIACAPVDHRTARARSVRHPVAVAPSQFVTHLQAMVPRRVAQRMQLLARGLLPLDELRSRASSRRAAYVSGGVESLHN
jgi:hypothetical protein